MYAKYLTNGNNKVAEVMLSEQEHGLTKGWSCIDCIFAMTQLIEMHRELNIVTYIAFINHSKAFDRVN
jgi:hypothetical protein